MPSMWKRAMLYLGLGPDEEYDDYAPPEEPPASQVAARPVAPPEPPPEPPSGVVRTMAREPDAGHGAPGRTAVVRPIVPVPAVKVVAVSPTGFNDAQEIGDKFKDGQPVIMNTQGLDVELRRRLVDFASGLCYGLGGHMERVANQVYLLTPSNVEVSAEEKRRLQERGLYQATT